MSEVIDADQGNTATVWSLPSLTSGFDPIGKNTAEHLDQIERAAHEDGFARGHEEGYRAGLQQAQATITRLQNILDHLQRPLADLDHEVEHAMVQLSVQVARKLVNEDLQLHPEHVAGAVHQAVAALAGVSRDLKIHVHPEDALILKDILAAQLESGWKLMPDRSMVRGDCRIVTDSGQVDGRLDTRQLNLTNGLLGVQA